MSKPHTTSPSILHRSLAALFGAFIGGFVTLVAALYVPTDPWYIYAPIPLGASLAFWKLPSRLTGFLEWLVEVAGTLKA